MPEDYKEIINKLGIAWYNDRTEESYTALYNFSRPIIQTYLRKQFSNIPNSKHTNIIDNCLFAMYEKIDQFNPEFKFIQWTSAIIFNEALQFFRRNKKYRELEIGKIVESDNFYLSEYSFSNVDEWIDQQYEDYSSPIVEEVLNSLEYPYKELLIDKYVNGLSVSEISEKYKLNPNTTKTKIRNGLIKVRRKLYPNQDDREIRKSRNRSRTSLSESGERVVKIRDRIKRNKSFRLYKRKSSDSE